MAIRLHVIIVDSAREGEPTSSMTLYAPALPTVGSHLIINARHHRVLDVAQEGLDTEDWNLPVLVTATLDLGAQERWSKRETILRNALRTGTKR
jgi:hypothetical protein